MQNIAAQNQSKLQRQTSLEYLTSVEVEWQQKETILELRQEMKMWQECNIPIEVFSMYEREGHRVVFTPSQYSDLQPIEFIWAQVNGNGGQKYCTETNLEEVKQLIDNKFEALQTGCRHVMVG